MDADLRHQLSRLADAEHQMRSTSERCFGSTFSFIVPEGFDVAGGDYSKCRSLETETSRRAPACGTWAAWRRTPCST
ncbi:hypothetical protein AJ87_14100 [Rhizobium yanglingense]|nr:hypothetical protein AJ87_14100 [Rhizobium yanglingense]